VGWLDWAREALTATLAAQILALPLILYHFGNLSIIAPLANVVLLPAFPLWLLLAYYAIVVGGWLWNATLADSQGVAAASGARLVSETAK
jgi:competence protein ComEC